MTPIAKSLGSEQMAGLSAHLAGLPSAARSAARKQTPARARVLATRGDERLRVQACQSCHGPGDAGQGALPYIAGLDRAYLASTLRQWKSWARDTDPSGQMQAIARRLGEKDIAALAAYFGGAAGAKPADRAHENGGHAADAPTKPGTGNEQHTGTGIEGGAASGGQVGPAGGAARPLDSARSVR